MGCWNETCFVSHLPIHYTDKTVLFILTPTMDVNKEGPTCYHDDKYAPLYFPLEGEYDDYGGIQNIKEAAYHEGFICKMKKYFTKEDDEFIPYTWESLDKFIGAIKSRNLFVSVPGVGYKRLALALMHAELYHQLVSHLGNRLVYGQEYTVRSAYETRVSESLEEFKELILTMPFCSGEFCEMMRLNPAKYRHIEVVAREYSLSSEHNSAPLIDFMLWHQVMMISRFGYCTNSGCGGQDSEYAVHKIIAQFILEQCDKYMKEMSEDEPEYPPESFLEECIYLL